VKQKERNNSLNYLNPATPARYLQKSICGGECMLAENSKGSDVRLKGFKSSDKEVKPGIPISIFEKW